MDTTEHPLEQPVIWIGLDVSKDTLDACLLRPTGKSSAKQFANDISGFAKLLRWAQHLALDALDAKAHFCLEATGSYSQGVLAGRAAVFSRSRATGGSRATGLGMVALAACMRKMLIIVYGVLKHQKPFDPAWQSQTQANPSS